MNGAALPVPEARQLKRLRELRERAAAEALRAAERLVAEAEDAVRQRLQALEHLQAERARVTRSIVHECAAQLGRLASYASAMQEDLDEQLERTEYALIDEEEALASAREQLATAHSAWRRALALNDSADAIVADARQAVRLQREHRLDREDAPSPVPSS